MVCFTRTVDIFDVCDPVVNRQTSELCGYWLDENTKPLGLIWRFVTVCVIWAVLGDSWALLSCEVIL